MRTRIRAAIVQGVRGHRRRLAAACAVALTVALIVAIGLDAQPRNGEGDGSAHEADRRAAFTAALLEAERSDSPLALVTDDRLVGYPLAAYVDAARIVRALRIADGAPPVDADVAADAFIDRHRDTPVVRQVERARLDSLARRAAWARLLEVAPAETRSAALTCLKLRARIETSDVDRLATDIADIWLTGHQLPIECEPVFEWLREHGGMSADLIEQRVRLLLENGHAAFARTVAGRLPAIRAAPWLRWAALIERPRESLDQLLADPATVLPEGALDDGWLRLARNAPPDALALYPALSATFGTTPARRSRFALALALGLAWDRRAEALDVFADVAPEHLDDYAVAWLARAALWHGRYRLAGNAITAMSAVQQGETRWRYWAARVAEAGGRRRDALRGYRAVLPADNFYAAMAAARLDAPVHPHQDDVPHERRIRAKLETLPALVRARELRHARLQDAATAEWRHALSSLAADERTQAIRVAADWGWYDVAVATATAENVFYDYRLLYPLPFADAVSAAAEESRIEPALIYALIRQESLYRPDAASAAGALGLMQLLPDTARRAARRLGAPAPGRGDLLTPATSVRLGAAQLRALFDTFDGQLPVALAGYNAGPNAARRWLPHEPVDWDVWIENIPYNETRDYVQRVLWHRVVFAWLDSGEPRDSSGWLSEVRASQASEGQASDGRG